MLHAELGRADPESGVQSTAPQVALMTATTRPAAPAPRHPRRPKAPAQTVQLPANASNARITVNDDGRMTVAFDLAA